MPRPKGTQFPPHLPTVCGEHTARAVKGAGCPAAPHPSRTAAGVLFPVMAMTILRSTGPAIPRDGRRFHAFHHPGAQHGLVHHAGIDALQPVVPPTQHVLQESDLRAGKRKMRIGMCPRADSPLRGTVNRSRAGAELYSYRHRSSRPRRKPDIESRCNPRTPNRASNRSRVAGARATSRRTAGVRQALQPRRSPALSDKHGSGGRHIVPKKKRPIQARP